MRTRRRLEEFILKSHPDFKSHRKAHELRIRPKGTKEGHREEYHLCFYGERIQIKSRKLSGFMLNNEQSISVIIQSLQRAN